MYEGGGFTGVYRKQTLPVYSFSANHWGLYNVHGNVMEWTLDCLHVDYAGAPTDGSAWTKGDCSLRALSAGNWDSPPSYLRAASRFWIDPDWRYVGAGFRLARTLTP